MKNIKALIIVTIVLMLSCNLAFAASPTFTRISDANSWFLPSLGINTDSPQLIFDVNGSASISGYLQVGNTNVSLALNDITVSTESELDNALSSCGERCKININENITINNKKQINFDRMTIECQSRNTKIAAKDGLDDIMFQVLAEKFTLRNCFIDGNGANNDYTNKGLFNVNANESLFENNIFVLDDMVEDGDCIRLDFDSYEGVVVDNNFYGGRNAVFFYNNNIISNNVAERQGHLCYFGRLGRRNTVTSNLCKNSGSGIGFVGSDVTTSKLNIISDNVIKDVEDGNGIYLNMSESNTVTGNTIFNTTFDGIRLQHASFNTIGSNVVDSVENYGINLIGNSTDGSRFNIIESNQITNDFSKTEYAIFSNSNVNNFNKYISNMATNMNTADVSDASGSSIYITNFNEINKIREESIFYENITIQDNLELTLGSGVIINMSSSSTGLALGEDLGILNFYSSDTSSNGKGDKSRIWAENTGSFGNYIDLVFGTSNSLQSSYQERMRINGDGNVAINDLSGTYAGGSAYVCVNNTGTLFASEVACP